jgi:hypothetical protein
MVVQAQESGDRGIAVAWRPGKAEVAVLGPDGGGVNGLTVSINGASTQSCGDGCYAASLPATRTVKVSVGGKTSVFRIPAKLRPAGRLVSKATNVFRDLRSVEYVERLASSPRNKVVSDFTLERPDRLMYRIRGGADGIIIGTRRWDRTNGGKWIPSAQQVTQEPEPLWSGHFTNAYLLQTTPREFVVSFFKPIGPVWFTVRLDRKTLLPRSLHMTAASHFMTHRYTSFNGPRQIYAPR